MIPQELRKKANKDAENFIVSYVPKVIDKKKFEKSKTSPKEYIFTKNEILEEFQWKNGTFYNRLKDAMTNENLERGCFIKTKGIGDKTEKLFFSYECLCELLKVYFIKDLKYGQINSQNTVKEEFNNSSTSNQNDGNLNDNTKVLYEQLLAEKDKLIDSLKNQVEDLMEIIKAKEARELELAKVEFLKKQEQMLINDADGNRKQSIFEKLFGRRKEKNRDNTSN